MIRLATVVVFLFLSTGLIAAEWNKHIIVARADGMINSAMANDYDGDGNIDVITSYDGRVVLLRGPDWQPHTVHVFDAANSRTRPRSECIHSCLSTIDLDGDGDIDIATCGYEANGTAVWYENDGRAKFTKHTIGQKQGSYDIRAIDMDSDGDLDLLIAGHFSQNLIWYENPQQ